MVKTTTSKASPQGPEEIGDRRQEILAVASLLFAKRGFDAVSVRQIADAAGIMGGSLYHHFSSKKELYLEVHSAALTRAAERTKAAIEGLVDPWERLEAACAEHLAVQLDPNSLTLPLMSDLSAMSGEMRVELIRQRDAFEVIYRELIEDLPLRPEIDRHIYRLSLVSLINTVPFWYRQGRLSPREIATQIAWIFRDPGSASAAQALPRKAPAAKRRPTKRGS